jgi:catechol 2,3-dioxygenase-like lactoylglutathione lyase family enzyme
MMPWSRVRGCAGAGSGTARMPRIGFLASGPREDFLQGLGVVLNVRDVERSLESYTEVLGLSPERVESWRAGKIGFPSVRLNETTIIDLARVKDDQAAPGGSPNLNHFCLYTDDDMDLCVAELKKHGIALESDPHRNWGARGEAISIKFRDPDSNQVEIRSYASIASDVQQADAGAEAR